MTREKLNRANKIVEEIERLTREINNVEVGVTDYIKLTDEDIQALVESRKRKVEALKKELEEL